MPMHRAPCNWSAKGRAIAKNTLVLAPTIKGKIKTQKRKRACKEGMLFPCHSLFSLSTQVFCRSHSLQS